MPGGPPGLQNRWRRVSRRGGFDSRPPPPPQQLTTTTASQWNWRAGLDIRRRIPRTDTLMADTRLAAAAGRLGQSVVKSAVIMAQQRARNGDILPEQVVAAAISDLPAFASALRPVINATGVLVHTNLGRSPLSGAAIEAVIAAAGYVDVELDLATGMRTRRGRSVTATLTEAVTAAEAAHVVNNNAAGLVLAATALAQGKEIIISRGNWWRSATASAFPTC